MVTKDTLWHVAPWYGRATGVSTRSTAPRMDRKVRRCILIKWAELPGFIVEVLARTLARCGPLDRRSSGASARVEVPVARTECIPGSRYHDHPRHGLLDPGPRKMTEIAAELRRCGKPVALMVLAVLRRRRVSVDAQLTAVRSTGNWPAPLLTRAASQTLLGAGTRRSPIH